MISSRTGLISGLLDKVIGDKNKKAAKELALQSICCTSAQKTFRCNAKGGWITFCHWCRCFAFGDHSLGLPFAVLGVGSIRMEGEK